MNKYLIPLLASFSCIVSMSLHAVPYTASPTSYDENIVNKTVTKAKLPLSHIYFGSCGKQYKPMPIFDAIVEDKRTYSFSSEIISTVIPRI